jgi:two-component system cell cycle response regulator
VAEPRSPSSGGSGGRPSTFDQDFEEVTSVSAAPPTLEARRLAVPLAPSRATLTLVSGPSAGAIYPLLMDESVIGRTKECSIRIEDPGISRRHARIVRRGPNTYFLEDLGSRNGTFVRGNRVTNQPLSEGDRLAVGPSVEFRFGFTDEAEEGLLRRLYESSVLDALTGAYNRKHFAERLGAELAYAKRHKTPLSLLMFDLDHFKSINDTFGHLGGDHVLRTVAALVKKTLRAEDVFARYGGEEFAIIGRGIDVEKAFMFGERVRVIIESARIEFNSQPISVTVSVGAASLACCTDPSPDGLVAKADERLYAAKRGGRNRTVGA